jgi:hypothetical protein
MLIKRKTIRLIRLIRGLLSKMSFDPAIHLTDGFRREIPKQEHTMKRLSWQIWLDYMEHLNKSSPCLFSLALRTNPFNRSASLIVRES